MPPLTIPSTVEALTTEWVAASLRASDAIAPEVSVLAIEPELIGEGVGFLSHVYRLHLTLDGPGPSTVVAKLPTKTDYLELAQGVGAYTREIAFYRAVAPACPLRTPRVHAAQIEGDANFVLLMEDLSHLDNGDHLAGISFARAERVIDELVQLHAWGWDLGPDEAGHQAFSALNSPMCAHIYSMGVAAGWAAYAPRSRVAIPEGLSTVIEQWSDRLPTMLSTLAEPTTIINGDLRVDNLFFDTDGATTIVDFQMTMLGAGIWDVAYLVGQGMSSHERAGREHQLVERYVDGLAAAGVRDYTITTAWDQFRTALVAQLTMPLTAGMSWDALPERAKELLHTLNERAFAIIADTDALASLDS